MILQKTPRPQLRLLRLSALAVACTLAPLAGCRHRNPMPTPAEENTLPMPNPRPNQNQTGPAQPRPGRKPKRGHTPGPAEAAVRVGLPVTLKSDRAVYRRGETITFTMTLRNASTETQSLRFTSGQDFDLAARRADAAPEAPESWRWANDKVFAMNLREVSLRPGQEQTFTATWDQSAGDGQALPRGSYTIASEIASEPRLPSNTISIELSN